MTVALRLFLTVFLYNLNPIGLSFLIESAVRWESDHSGASDPFSVNSEYIIAY